MQFLHCFVFASVTLLSASAQQRTVAITVDDLPYVAGHPVSDAAAEAPKAKAVNRALLDAFHAHHVPVTVFVREETAENLGPAGAEILRQWKHEGFDLGNHTYSHPDINTLSVEQIQNEIIRGERTIGRVKFFRFPYNHTGDTKLKHDAIAAFLKERGYELATCTIDTSDYLFNQAYVRMLANNDSSTAEKLRREYTAYTDTEMDYYAKLNKQVLGYEPPEVMLLHAIQLNADVMDQVLKLFEDKQYKFVTLSAAQSDKAYRIPDTYITKYGPMWGYRWANERDVKVNGRLEQEPSQWILDYGKREFTTTH